jgi:alkanesulfonate monooxygenase SsuD/methylene tetrahydromethanopterin reductase-like flavin-dependent oxidoreductase (luciferase family)
MDFGALVLAQINAAGLARHAEDRGFTHWWVGEGQMLFSEPYAYMALCATMTRSIKLGIGVTNPLTRIPPVTANAVATINALAPGRVILGLGTGNNAMRAMGMRPARMAELREALLVCRKLLAGEQVEYTFDGRTRPIAMLDPQGGWYNIADRIPLYVAAGGPQALELAGELADGVIVTAASEPLVRLARHYVQQGAARAGRKLSDITFVAIGWFYLARPGETHADIIQRGVGSGPISGAITVAEGAAQHPELVDEALIHDMQQVAGAYRPAGDPRTRHLTAWRQYMKGLDPAHADLITPRLVDAFCVTGAAAECLEKIRRLQTLGVDQFVILPSSPANVVRDVEDFSRTVIEKL